MGLYSLPVRLQSIDPDKNRFRQYCLRITPGLFGDYCLCIRWGRIGTEGNSKGYWYQTSEEALLHADRIIQKRLKRGYTEKVSS